MELVTIPFSHFNERARWALNHFGQVPRERRYLPMFHLAGALWATRGRVGRADSHSSPLSTPILLTETETIHDSAEILRWADARYGNEETTLYPAEHREEIMAFERDVHDSIGGETRRLAYFVTLQTPGRMRQMARTNVGAFQATCFRALGPLIMSMLKRRLSVDRPHAERSEARIEVAFEHYDRLLEGREYLFANRFTAADLTLAAIASPVLHPLSGYGATIPALDDIAPDALETIEKFRATRTGQHVIRMFALHRKNPAPRET